MVDGVVYVDSTDDHVYALDAQTGAKRWSAAFGSGFSSPAVVDGVVYVATDDHVYALDARTGAKRWGSAVDNASSPAVADGVVYVAGIIDRGYDIDPYVYALHQELHSDSVE